MNLNLSIIRETTATAKSNRFRLIDKTTTLHLYHSFLNISLPLQHSLRKHPFLLARFAPWTARNVPSGQEGGETEVFAGYCSTTTTWKCLISRFVQDVNTRQRLSYSFSWTLIQSFRIHLQKNLPTFYELTRWNKRDKVWSGANSLFSDVFVAVAVVVA